MVASFVTMGVLQYLAVAYWCTAMITLLIPKCGEFTSEELDSHELHPTDDDVQLPWYYVFRDLYPNILQWLVVLCILVVQVCLSKFLPTWDDCPTGQLAHQTYTLLRPLCFHHGVCVMYSK